MMNLFNEDATERKEEEKLAETTTTMQETLTRLEQENVRLLEDLAAVAKKQKALQSEVRRVERERKAALKEVAEHRVPEGQELTLEDVEAWCRSAYSNMAHTMPGNPHCYFSRKRSRNPRMYERVVAYVLENGYPQRYGSDWYTVLDVRLNSTSWFIWPMTNDPSESEVLNLKPDSMRPEKQ